MAVRRLALALAILAAGTVRAADEGPFLGEAYRWANRNVVSRALYDVVAIPANVGSWDRGDWLQLAFWTGAVAVPWMAANPSLDVRIDRWASSDLNPSLPPVWNDWSQPLLWTSIAVAGFGTWAWALTTGNDDVAQGCSLMGEALAVFHVYHLTFKLLIGRDGPRDGDHTGQVKGPANAVAVFPGGTPSGHAGTLFSLTSATFAYFRPPGWVQAIGYAGVGSLAVFHVVDHRHFLSETIWGSAMGWYIGQWVVRHRASWLYGERDRGSAIAIVPAPVGGSPGIVLTGWM